MKRENMCKQCNQGVNFQNIQIVHVTQYQKKHNSVEKSIPKQTVLWREHTDDRQAHEETVNMAKY